MTWIETKFSESWTEFSGEGGGVLVRIDESQAVDHFNGVPTKGEGIIWSARSTSSLKEVDGILDIADEQFADLCCEARRKRDSAFFGGLYEMLLLQSKADEATKTLNDVFSSGEEAVATPAFRKALWTYCSVGSRGRNLRQELAVKAIEAAANRYNAIPTVGQVAGEYAAQKAQMFELKANYHDEIQPERFSDNIVQRNGKPRIDKFKPLLAAVGFGWLPSRARGDTLRARRKVP